MPDVGDKWDELADVVYGYLEDLSKGGRFAVKSRSLKLALNRDSPGWADHFDLERILLNLNERGLIEWVPGEGWIPLSLQGQFSRQLGMPEVVPFTREPGESLEAHIDKFWDVEKEELVKPEAGGKWGLAPIVQYLETDKRWKGLTKEGP